MTYSKLIHPLSRRHFLKGAVGTSALFGIANLSPLKVWAQASSQDSTPFFVLIKAPGGMDVTLGLDPIVRPPGTDEQDMFIEYSQNEILSHSSQTEMRVGPAATALLPNLDRTLIFNGVVMNESDNGHTANLNYVATANGQGKNASLAGEAILARQSQNPFGIVANSSVILGKRALAVTQTGTIIQSLTSADLSVFFERIQQNNQSESPFRRSLRAISASKAEASELNRLLQLWQKDASLEDFHAVASAFASGMASSAELSLNSFSLDTHSDHPRRHKDAQTRVWQRVASIFSFFKSIPFAPKSAPQAGSSLFDHTVFVVVSDFSRTPFLNASKGKDHNPLTNSILVAGGPIKKGKMIGQSRLVPRGESGSGEAMHIGLPLDYATGATIFSRAEAAPHTVNFVHPENVAGTVASLMGLDFRKSGAIPQGTESIPIVW